MASSQNGWPAGEDRAALGIRTFVVPGTAVKLPLRADVAPLILEFGRWWHEHVEALRPDWCWGYAYRPVRGATALSNHASGTAADFNAPLHPLGKAGTLGGLERAVIDKAASLGLRSGAAYKGRRDDMHVEVVATPAEVARLVAALQAPPDPAAPAPASPAGGRRMLRRGDRGRDVGQLQEVLGRWYPSLGLRRDDDFGPATEAAVRHLQHKAGLLVTGVAEADTYRALGMG